MSEENKTTTNRRLKGTVLSTNMDKTAVVRVDRTVIHSKYKKRYEQSKKYKVHDEKNELKVDDVVIFAECRPLSKDKCWRLIEVVK